jgi:hypothetical protein
MKLQVEILKLNYYKRFLKIDQTRSKHSDVGVGLSKIAVAYTLRHGSSAVRTKHVLLAKSRATVSAKRWIARRLLLILVAVVALSPSSPESPSDSYRKEQKEE